MTMNKPVLLDTHVFVWALEQSDKIGYQTKQLIQNAPAVYVSVASLWELAIKFKTGKFQHDTKKLQQGLTQSNFALLPINPAHIEQYANVVLPHADPFDTVMVAQSVAESLILITADKQILSQSSEYILQNASR